MYDSIERAYASLDVTPDWQADVAVILGTGLGGLVAEITVEKRLAYSEIAGFPVSTVAGHAGELVLGHWRGRRLAVFSGRFHLYEGYSAKEIAMPVYLARRLGASRLLVTNCAGGLNPLFEPGDIMMITDHINLLGANPLVGTNDERLGVRFPDMSTAYCKQQQQVLRVSAAGLGLTLREGIYVAVPGPSLETNAERRYLAGLGADAVGMSTALEVIAARHAGMRVVGLSAISNSATGGPEQEPDTLESIMNYSALAGDKMRHLIADVIAAL